MSRADAGVFPDAERSHSGLVHRSRKPEWLNGHRGFESHPLRHMLTAYENGDMFLVSRFACFSTQVSNYAGNRA